MVRLLKNAPQWVLASIVLVSILTFYAIAAVRYPMLYIWATYEDLFGEWMQFWCLAVSFYLSFRMAMRRGPYRWFFSLLALSCFYAAMEEISWGQRIFGFSSPAYFKENNLQGEMNLHNFLTGPYATTLKATITYALASALLLYGFIYPLALKLRLRFVVWWEQHGLAAPPLYAGMFFVAGAILEVGPFGFNEGEVAEILVGVALVLTTAHYAFMQRHRLPASSWSADRLAGLSRRHAAVLTVVMVLAATTTLVVYRTPSGFARIDRRVHAGMKRFAGRYARYERWDVVLDLYERLRQRDPQSVTTLRHLAKACAKMGNETCFQRRIDEALAVDMGRYEKHPDGAGVNRSLARTYRLMGDRKRANNHLAKALRYSLRSVKKNPRNPEAVYSLGKTYAMLGRKGDAFETISKAYRLNPASKKLRKAYYRAKRKLNKMS